MTWIPKKLTSEIRWTILSLAPCAQSWISFPASATASRSLEPTSFPIPRSMFTPGCTLPSYRVTYIYGESLVRLFLLDYDVDQWLGPLTSLMFSTTLLIFAADNA